MATFRRALASAAASDASVDASLTSHPAAVSSLKRALDVTLAATLAVALLPLLLLIALAVRLDSAGPVLFAQERVGLNGSLFRMWKFRSMRLGVDDGLYEEVTARWFSGEMPPGGYKPLRDPRVTRVGRVLRQTSLDELPQLMNVLRGEMSMVGPRPMRPDVIAQAGASRLERHMVRPGLTGLWQVSDRYRISAPEMMELDIRYVREWSHRLDLAILARTPAAAVHLGREGD